MNTRNEVVATLKQLRGECISVAAFSATSNVLMLVPSLYMMQIYDRVISSGNEVTLLMLTLMTVGVVLLVSALDYVRTFVLLRCSERFDGMLSSRVYTAAFQNSLQTPCSNPAQPLKDVANLRQFISGNALPVFFDVPWFPIYVAVIFLFAPVLGIFALAGTAVLIALAYLNEKLTAQAMDEANEMSLTAANTANNDLRNAEVIEALGMLPRTLARWSRLHANYLTLQAPAAEKSGTIKAITKFVQVSLQSLVLALGALLVIEDKMSAGMMIAASILVGRAMAPVQQLIGIWKAWGKARLSYQRLVTLLEKNPVHAEALRLPRPNGHMRLEGVIAKAPSGNFELIKGLSFELEPGDVLGIIGPSGGGKSVLARMMVGVWQPTSGKVRLDGADISTWSKAELGPYIGYLPQDIELFAGTISENICRFSDAEPEAIVAAAEMAGVHEMILRLPHGYETVVGQSGTRLSGGQRQRIGLARALFGEPALVVLDEPNSNLDKVGEQALLHTLTRLRERGTTVAIVTHKNSVIAATTKLLLLRNGIAAQFGPSEQVLAAISENRQNRSGRQRERSGAEHQHDTHVAPIQATADVAIRMTS